MLKTDMGFSLPDIMDLDFFLDLDEARDDPENIAVRDRDIYHQIDRSGPDDPPLILSWLDYRRLLYFHEAGDNALERLPGTLYAALYRWMVRGGIVLGLITGLVTAYSFLAYHGGQPVNVTLFIAFFILFPALLSIVAGTIMVRWIQSGGHSRSSIFHTLVFEFLMKKFRFLVKRAWALPGLEHMASSGEPGILDRFTSRNYRGLLFWPIFLIFSLGALCFSLGALGSTLFRVMVADLAFGWQSTLFTSGDQIQTMVAGLALPWSWILPEGSALPSLDQIEGSRIILKQGIAGLATKNLTAWWPFLSMGILVYGVIPRIILAVGALGARHRALAGLEFTRPRYKRLVMRMRSPRMDTKMRETGGTRAGTRAPLPDPDICPVNGNDTEPAAPVLPADRVAPVPVLASERAYPDSVMADMALALDRQLGIDASGVTRIHFDIEADKPTLATLAETLGPGPVIILQEVWQPPIRGLLSYFVRIRQEIFPGHDIWIFLTQTPGEEGMGVDNRDMDYKVWQTAVAQLKDPGILLERWVADVDS